MRAVRSAVALISALAVMACQTAATVAGAGRLVPVTAATVSPSAVAGSALAQPAATATQSRAASVDSWGSGKRKTILIVAVVAAVIVAAVLISGSGDGSSGY